MIADTLNQNNSSVKRTNLLILNGIYINDYLIKEPVIDEVNEVAAYKYDEIPKKFVSVDTWPTHTNLLCWSCSQKFTSYPKFIPLHPEIDKNGRDICDIIGNFCEWNCAARYIQEVMPEVQRWDLNRFLARFECKFTKRRREIIYAAPPKTILKEYCGNKGITPEQWREKMISINAEYNNVQHNIEQYKDLTICK